MTKKNNFIYGRLSEAKKQPQGWGTKSSLWLNWDEFKLNGFLIEFEKETSYEQWADLQSENLCIVENGSGIISLNGVSHALDKRFAFKIYPGQKPLIYPDKTLTVFSVQMPNALEKFRHHTVNLNKIEIINTEEIPSKVYEFETLGQEIFTPKYKGGLGLIKFAFVNPIPIHTHPFSGRIIRPISGKGYTFVEPHLYEAHNDTYLLFPKGIVHTNGNIPGEVLRLYAFQLPWIESGIDHENIAGSPKFVQYVGVTPPKQLWKNKKDFERVIKKLENK